MAAGVWARMHPYGPLSFACGASGPRRSNCRLSTFVGRSPFMARTASTETTARSGKSSVGISLAPLISALTTRAGASGLPKHLLDTVYSSHGLPLENLVAVALRVAGASAAHGRRSFSRTTAVSEILRILPRRECQRRPRVRFDQRAMALGRFHRGYHPKHHRGNSRDPDARILDDGRGRRSSSSRGCGRSRALLRRRNLKGIPTPGGSSFSAPPNAASATCSAAAAGVWVRT
jgi:hypothetical protein